MDFETNPNSPILGDPVPLNMSRLAFNSNLVPYSPPAAPFSSSGLYISTNRRKPMPGKLDNGWLDAMLSSSPPRKRVIKGSSFEDTLDEADAAYRTWLLEYPSALTSFKQIVNNAAGKKIALFLDYDGTLSPIVDNPDHAFMSNTMRKVVQDVAKHFPTAIISGRSRDKVYQFVRLTELYYAGSHGMDIISPIRESGSVSAHSNCVTSIDKQGKEVNLFQPARDFLPMIEEVFRTLVEITKDIEGSKVENNKFCISVHYRNVEETSWPLIAQCVEDVMKDFPRLRLTHGRKVLEVRPVIDWNKGKAVEFLLESLGLRDREDVLPIYVGDDRTDEDAFKVLREGGRGYGILVSSVPKETNAFYSVRDPSEVMRFLKLLLKLERGSPNHQK